MKIIKFIKNLFVKSKEINNDEYRTLTQKNDKDKSYIITGYEYEKAKKEEMYSGYNRNRHREFCRDDISLLPRGRGATNMSTLEYEMLLVKESQKFYNKNKHRINCRDDISILPRCSVQAKDRPSARIKKKYKNF